MSMFRITGHKGFHITFENGWTVSVQFGPGNYCDNYDMAIGADEVKAGKRGSTTAECAVFSPQRQMVQFPGSGDDTVTNRNTANEVLEILKWAAAQNGEAVA